MQTKQESNVSADVLVQLGTTGSAALLKVTKEAVGTAIKQKGPAQTVGFPDTNYYLPLSNALLKMEIKTLADCESALAQAKALDNNRPAANGFTITALGGVLNKGIASLICEEILAALKYLNGEHPQPSYAGFLSDVLLRSLGVQLVDGRIAGIAVILGPAKDEDSAVRLIRDMQAKGIVSILVGKANNTTFRKQLENKKVEMGLDNYIVPLGEDYLSAIYAVNWAIRAPLTFGGLKSGQWQEILKYEQTKVPAFVVLLSNVDEILVATGLGVLAMGFPIISDLDVPQLGKIDTTLYEAVVTEKDYAKIAARCVETRGIKVKIANVQLPVPYGAAFEGERVRKEQMHIEFGGRSSMAFEYLVSRPMKDVEDGKIEIIGPDMDQPLQGKKTMPLAIIVEVSGRKMVKDFESILERQIHKYINYTMGLMHVGQRDMIWIRVSADTFNKGFRLRHIGLALHAMLHQEYNAIVDKAQVKFYTRQADIEKLLAEAKKTYEARDARISGMTDESVDTFYSCTLCQSFAPDHVCMISPERLGLCGAYSWLDGKAAYEITPTGGNQPVKKGKALNEKEGIWEGINKSVLNLSHNKISQISVYSLMNSPMTSCGCFECIVAIVPEANGVLIVNREYSGMTPAGMNFTTLAGSVGGGAQTPGFLGVGRLYITSRKFIAAEGGLKRIVWMPKELKEALADKFKKRSQEIGEPDFIDKIADETSATDAEGLLKYLEKKGHPALSMPPLM
ncbi:MAG: acetyl-CoA decarbonylase/synthase complex subunit alpha/beta [Candidatus Omnitrophica bacterium]|nr:acetyl-CoA decarbonylase/synthase complex subunit alpha/beta [Candidatus Omnitrophota bacterium]